jgi:HK97 family phage portal protein
MAWWNPFERRAAIVPATSREGIMQVLFGGDYAASSTGITVTIENALTVPAVSAAVNFIAETMASLPAELYRESGGNRTEIKSGISRLFSDAPNDFMSAFDFRKQLYVDKLTHGRGLAYIEKNDAGTPINLWLMDPARTVIKRDNWVNYYEFSNPDGRKLSYTAAEVIDLPFMLRSDGFTHRSPISLGREAIGLALAATQYGAKFLANGGVPPFAVTGGFQSPGAAQRAADDFTAAVRKAASEKRQALVMPTGMTIQQIGTEPEKTQLVELQRFCVEQIARIYSLPPTFLQDLTHGTYSNTEQQDLHFAKHTVLHHVEQFEREVNLKIFGRRANSQCIELEMDGLLRGDFKTRMDGWARAVQGGILTPNEARESENYPPIEGGDKLFMQGATMPIDAIESIANDPATTGTARV